jgi:hypothetical protein
MAKIAPHVAQRGRRALHKTFYQCKDCQSTGRYFGANIAAASCRGCGGQNLQNIPKNVKEAIDTVLDGACPCTVADHLLEGFVTKIVARILQKGKGKAQLIGHPMPAYAPPLHRAPVVLRPQK